HQQLNRIKKLLGNNQLTLATAEALRLASILPDQARWHSELGLVFNQLKHYDQAMGLFERAVQLAPDAADHHYNLATVQRFVGRIDQAQHSLQKALALNP
ncbi:tetratricopeptide repeat protein, partial [Bowmanella dokdonensis]